MLSTVASQPNMKKGPTRKYGREVGQKSFEGVLWVEEPILNDSIVQTYQVRFMLVS